MIGLSNENIIHVKKENVEYIQFRKLLEYEDVLTHCFTLRSIDFKSNETMENDKEEAKDNYKIICDDLGLNCNRLIRPYQTHSDNIKKVDKMIEDIQIFSDEYKEVDGLITNQKEIVLSLGYADCIPIYLFDPVNKVIGNIHSGWKGTVQRIGVKAVNKMKAEYGTNPENIICCIGPSIGKCHFEVKEDVQKIFYNEFKDIKEEFITEKVNKDGSVKYNIDTVLINRIILEEAGLKKENIISSNICTVCNEKYIHSYRAHKEMSGRNTALISIK